MTAPLHALSPLDGRYHTQTHDLNTLFSESALMKYRLTVEIEWLIFMSEKNLISVEKLSADERQALRTLVSTFNDASAKQIKAIEATTKHDVKAIEYFLIQHLPRRLVPFCHFGCTSEDINNLSYALMIKEAIASVMMKLLNALKNTLQNQAVAQADYAILSRTHGQAASPTTLGKELANFGYRLARQIKFLSEQEILGKFHGAVGNFNAHYIVRPDVDWLTHSRQFVEGLGLTFNPMVTQIEPHDYIAELSHTFSRINTILIDLSRDIWTYISLGYFKLALVTDEVGSSTMPHKINPIDFENAEGNLGLANALFTHFAEKLPISRLQRDLSDSTVLRNLGSALAYSALAYHSLIRGLTKITPNLAALKADLTPHYEVLTEAVQMALRYEGVENAYEMLKEAARGQAFTEADYQQFVSGLALREPAKSRLSSLTPETYLGLASSLAKTRWL